MLQLGHQIVLFQLFQNKIISLQANFDHWEVRVFFFGKRGIEENAESMMLHSRKFAQK